MNMCSFHRFFFIQIKLFFIWMVSHEDSFWNRGTQELVNGLLNVFETMYIYLRSYMKSPFDYWYFNAFILDNSLYRHINFQVYRNITDSFAQHCSILQIWPNMKTRVRSLASPVAVLSTPEASLLLFEWILSTTENFIHSIMVKFLVLQVMTLNNNPDDTQMYKLTQQMVTMAMSHSWPTWMTWALYFLASPCLRTRTCKGSMLTLVRVMATPTNNATKCNTVATETGLPIQDY